MRNCNNCGAPNADDYVYCVRCGQASGAAYAMPAPAGVRPDPRWDYTPISPWGFIGYNILFGIPVVGIILLFVFSFGGAKKINLRNYARSILWVILIGVILTIIFSGSIIAFFNNISYY